MNTQGGEDEETGDKERRRKKCTQEIDARTLHPLPSTSLSLPPSLSGSEHSFP